MKIFYAESFFALQYYEKAIVFSKTEVEALKLVSKKYPESSADDWFLLEIDQRKDSVFDLYKVMEYKKLDNSK